jgi:hypothetical protein
VVGDVETTNYGSAESSLSDPDYENEMHSAGDVVFGQTTERDPYEN